MKNLDQCPIRPNDEHHPITINNKENLMSEDTLDQLRDILEKSSNGDPVHTSNLEELLELSSQYVEAYVYELMRKGHPIAFKYWEGQRLYWWTQNRAELNDTVELLHREGKQHLQIADALRRVSHEMYMFDMAERPYMM